MYQNKKIYIAGHNGMVGSATMRLLEKQGYNNLVYRSSKELNLTSQAAVHAFFEAEKPEIVILAAAKVGGIQANIDNPATFLIDNLQIQNNICEASLKNGVEKLVFLGSSCIYPKESPQPMKEEYLLTGKLEPTNEGYALAKIAGLKLLEGMYKQYGFKSISLMPCNLYGPNDSFDLKHSHVLSALVKRFTDAKALAAFAGLAPRVIESGSSVRGRGILSHYGVTWLRSQLYMCALSAMRWNKQCRELYLRLRAKGKSKKTAILAVAHKLIRQIYAVLTNNTLFDKNYSKYACDLIQYLDELEKLATT